MTTPTDPPKSKISAEQAFSAIDRNGDGQITVDELSPRAAKKADELFSKMDVDNDGVLTREEFRLWWGRRPPKALDQFEEGRAVRPTRKQLINLGIGSFVPFVGFGFLDNFVMIVCGTEIENHLGIVLGISTMAAAGLGNLVSDIAGVWTGNAIEAVAQKLGIPESGLSAPQLRLRISRMVIALCSALGIAVGCILGMVPLLWMDPDLDAARVLFRELDDDGTGKVYVRDLGHLAMRFGTEVSEAEFLDLLKRNGLDALEIDTEITFEQFLPFYKSCGEAVEQTKGWTKLLKATRSGDLDMVRQVIEGVPPEERATLVKAQDYDARTCLHIAAAENNPRIIELLINNGADPNALDRWGHTPYDEAVLFDKEESMEVIHSNNGSMSQRMVRSMNSKMWRYSASGKGDKLAKILRLDVDIDAANVEGRTCLHIAAAENQVEIVRLLLDFGADPSVRDRWGRTPQQTAAIARAYEAERVLMEVTPRIPNSLPPSITLPGTKIGDSN